MESGLQHKTTECPILKGLDPIIKRDFGDGRYRTERDLACLNCPLIPCFEERTDRRLYGEEKNVVREYQARIKERRGLGAP